MRSVGGDAWSTKVGHVLWPTSTLDRPGRHGNSTRLETPQEVVFFRGGSSRAAAKKTLRQMTVGKFEQMLHLCPLGVSIHRKRNA
ncbi:hypothetical protein GCM10008935_28860 [Alkalibacillus silvisoli]|uniref:Uncharacterized protein n=1 Tax=Alkalibacillus silvisoli TaxID=392823 RepID=A0ABN1A9U0_9BACI